MSRIFTLLLLFISVSNASAQRHSVDFYGNTFNFELDSASNIPVDEDITSDVVVSFYNTMLKSEYQPLIQSLLDFKEKHQLNDWIYYQLIRRTAQRISPKAENYPRYTLYKWFLLSKSGYDARLGVGQDKVIFYVRNNENIHDIPFFMEEGHKYMCLNYHDYGFINFEEENIQPLKIHVPEARHSFSYKVTRIPDFKPENYTRKDIEFRYRQKTFHFKVMLNPEVENMFVNYPVVDFEAYFNIPLSKETYRSLIPFLKENVKRMSQKRGVDYLMRFTRYAFLYQTDESAFGRERRLSPEQTLSSQYSDCDDRAALFFYLVKEIYDLPMIALLYPTHISMAVQFDKPKGRSIDYQGAKFTVCEPTPQRQDLRIGQVPSGLEKSAFEVVFHYQPGKSD